MRRDFSGRRMSGFGLVKAATWEDVLIVIDVPSAVGRCSRLRRTPSCVRARHLRGHNVRSTSQSWVMVLEVLRGAKKETHTVMSAGAELCRSVALERAGKHMRGQDDFTEALNWTRYLPSSRQLARGQCE